MKTDLNQHGGWHDADLVPNDLTDWLLTGNVAIQYQVRRDLLDEERPATCGCCAC